MQVENKEKQIVRIEVYKATNQKFYKDIDKLFDRKDAHFDDIFKTIKQMRELSETSKQHFDVIITFSTDPNKEYDN